MIFIVASKFYLIFDRKFNDYVMREDILRNSFHFSYSFKKQNYFLRKKKKKYFDTN